VPARPHYRGRCCPQCVACKDSSDGTQQRGELPYDVAGQPPRAARLPIVITATHGQRSSATLGSTQTPQTRREEIQAGSRGGNGFPTTCPPDVPCRKAMAPSSAHERWGRYTQSGAASGAEAASQTSRTAMPAKLMRPSMREPRLPSRTLGLGEAVTVIDHARRQASACNGALLVVTWDPSWEEGGWVANRRGDEDGIECGAYLGKAVSSSYRLRRREQVPVWRPPPRWVPMAGHVAPRNCFG